MSVKPPKNATKLAQDNFRSQTEHLHVKLSKAEADLAFSNLFLSLTTSTGLSSQSKEHDLTKLFVEKSISVMTQTRK